MNTKTEAAGDAARLKLSWLLSSGQPSLAPDAHLERPATPRHVELSFVQQRLWTLDRLGLGGSAHNILRAYSLTGRLNDAALARAIAELVARHEVCRTRFIDVGGQGRQVIDAAGAAALEIVDLEALVPSAAEAAVAARLRAEAETPFDLQAEPLFRSVLLRLAAERCVLILTTHPIVCDEASLSVLCGELNALYGAAVEGRPASLGPLTFQYADYAAWQREQLRDHELAESLAYWRRRLDGAPAQLELPTDRPRPKVGSFRGDRVRFTIPAEVHAGLSALALREGCSLFVVALAAFQMLLGRWVGQHDVVVGAAVSGRTRPELEGLIGLFVNTLPLRTDLSGAPRFRDLLARVGAHTLEDLEHQELPFEKLVAEFSPEHSLARQPVVQVVLGFHNTLYETLDLPGLKATSLAREVTTTGFDMGLHLFDLASRFEGYLEYATELFERDTISRFAGHYVGLLAEIVRTPDLPITDYVFLGEAEQRTLLVDWNDTSRPLLVNRCVHELFAEIAARTPEQIAVLDGERTLSYRQLNGWADAAAAALRDLGVQPGDRVGLLGHRSDALVAGMLAALKCGAAYVPMDESYPLRRLAFIAQDCALKAVLLGPGAKLSLPELPTVALQGLQDAAAPEISVPLSADSAAYVAYTSGSTGEPKGSVSSHRAITHLVVDNSYADLHASDRIAHLSSPSFDATTFEVWGALLNGGTVVIIPSDVALAPARLAAALYNAKVTVAFITTALFCRVAAETPGAFAGLRHLLVGGEILDPSYARLVLERGTPRHLCNVYGPTESTTFSTVFDISPADPPLATVPIGRPIANARVYVLDARMGLAPIGVAGELYIGGAGLAQGYLDRPGLTAERFVADPFGRPGGRLYRTGDRVRWRSDGMLEYLGRFDDQVKVGEHRIEPGEVEAHLRRHPDVVEAVAVVREDSPGTRRLVAYVTVRAEGAQAGGTTQTGEQGALRKDVPLVQGETEGLNDPAAAGRPPLALELREQLKAELPDYMMPSRIVLLEALPTTPNGKLDRKALPAPDTGMTRQAFVPPRPGIETALAQIWAKALRLERVGAEDNFFELGGHSVLVVRMLAQVRQQWGVELPFNVFLENAKLRSLAGHLEVAIAFLATNRDHQSASPAGVRIEKGTI